MDCRVECVLCLPNLRRGGVQQERMDQGTPLLQPRLRQEAVLKQMRSQCWGLEAAACIACVSARTRRRTANSESAPVAGAHNHLQAQANQAERPNQADQADQADQQGQSQCHNQRQDQNGMHSQPDEGEGQPQGSLQLTDIDGLFADWSVAYRADPLWKESFEGLQRGELCGRLGLCHQKIRQGGRTVVPASLVQPVIEAMHSYSHPGVDKLTQLCRRIYIFPAALEERVKDLLQGCSTCQTCKARSNPSADTQQFWPIPEFPFASLAMDFVKLDECKIDGEVYDTVFAIVDRLTGYVMGIPCRDEGLTAEKAAALFLDRCVHFVGLPHEIMSDNDNLMSKKLGSSKRSKTRRTKRRTRRNSTKLDKTRRSRPANKTKRH